MSVAANPYVRPAAIEDLVPIGRAVRVMATATATAMMLLVMLVTAATTAAAIAAATRPLPIVWSH
jgi:hypothetical protein